MSGNEGDSIADQFASQRHRLIGVASIIAHYQLNAVPEDAALGVQILRSMVTGRRPVDVCSRFRKLPNQATRATPLPMTRAAVTVGGTRSVQGGGRERIGGL
jgi:hypothetical protein